MSENSDTKPRSIRFTPEISAGHLMQAACLVFAVVAAYFALDKRISILESQNPKQSVAAEKVVTVEANIEMIERQQESLRDDLKRIEGKLDRLIERKD